MFIGHFGAGFAGKLKALHLFAHIYVGTMD
jgi:hypothetical protein